MPDRIAVFPGQFDPITNGHLDVIERGVKLFDRLVVGIGVNPGKDELFSLEDRAVMVRKLLAGEPKVHVETYTGLTADFVKRCAAIAILRGIRDVSDLRYEFQLALANRAVGDVETVFIMTGEQYALTSSSLIRQVCTLGGDVASLGKQIPDIVVEALQQKQAAGAFTPQDPDGRA
ncbi:MAG: pantetheine-phosphate adenylyltransferase [Planctomycetota bacterium]